MSTTTGAGHAPHDQYVDYDEFVDFQIEKARNHIKTTDIFTTLTTLLAAFVGYLLLFVVFDQWVFAGGFSDWARLSLLGVMLTTMAAILIRSVVFPLIRRVHPLYAARMLEKSDPKLQSNLLNFVDLQHSEGIASSAPVVRAMQKRAALELSHIDVDEAIDRRPLLRVAYVLLAIVIVSALYIVLSPKDPFQSVKRAFGASIAVATETTISEVTPGDDHVPARTLLTIEADVRGKDADRVQILFTTADHKYVDEAVEMHRIDADLPRFRGTLNGENGRGLLQSLRYSIAAGDARTREFEVDVVQPPTARVDDVNYSFPTYMQLQERTTPGGNIDGWEGAAVTVHATANMPVKSATIVLTDSEDPHAKGEEIAMEVVDGTKLTGRWKLEFRTDGTFARFYHVQLRTAKNESDPDPALHTLRIRPDQRPEVELVFPRGDLTREHAKPANAIVPLVIEASDPDFQLRSIRLMAESNGEELRIPPLFDGRELGQSFRGSYDWDLSRHNLRPGQVVQFWIEARDNKQPTANRGVTPRLTLEIREEKSAEEIQKDLVAEKKDQEDQLAQADDTRNAEGREDIPGKESREETGDKPGDEKTDPKERASRPDSESPAETSDKDPDHRRDDRQENENATDADENRSERRSSKPSGDDNERALEKLLQKQADEEEQKKRDAERKPSEAQDQTQSGSDAKPSGKRGTKKDEREKPSAGDEGDKNSSETENDPRGKPSGKPGDTPRPEGAPEKSTKGGDKKPDKSGKSGESPDPKAGRNSEKSTDPSQGGPSRDDKKNPGAAKNSDAKKQPGEKPEKKPPTSPMTGGEKKTDDSAPGDKDKGKEDGEKGIGGRDKPGEDPGMPPEEKSGDKEGSDKKPGKNATNKTESSENSSTPESGNRDDSSPPSDGKGDDENATSEDSGNQSGTPSKSKSKGGPESPGDAEGGEPTKPDAQGADKKSNSDSDGGGEEEPAEDSPDAKKRKATGDETGEATGSQDEDNSDSVKAKKDLQRKPGSEPGKTKPSDAKKPSESKTGKPSTDKRNPEPGTSSATDDARDTKRAPDGKSPKESTPRTDDPPSSKSEPNRSNDRNKRPGDPPDAGNQPKKAGKTRPEPQRPQTGQDGNSAGSDQGKSGANKEGAGDKSPMSGDDVQSSDPTGKPGNKSGEGSTAKSRQTADNSTPKPGEGDSSAESSKPGKDNGKGGKPGEKSASKPGKGSQPGAMPDGQSANTSEGAGVTGAPSDRGATNDGEGSGSDGSNPTGDQPRNSDGTGNSPDQDEEADLENARKASNLLLKRLQKQLERGEVDQKLLDEMGWKDLDDVKNFTRYLEGNLRNTGEDNSAEAVARRLQFEETLKSMRLGNETERRTGGKGPERRVLPTSVRNVPLPAEYREIQEAYSKSIGKGTTARPEAGKPTPGDRSTPKK